jgi:dTDP-4-dehydrorhamnose 3,5-epimerase
LPLTKRALDGGVQCGFLGQLLTPPPVTPAVGPFAQTLNKEDTSMPFHFRRLSIPDVVLIQSKINKDERGRFQEIFKASDFNMNGVPSNFLQDNHSHSKRGVLRGLHYQIPPKAQGKLVIVVKGQVVDVAVDIRNGSPTYGQFVQQELSHKSGYMLYVPPGFAHGFCVTSREADVLYKVTAEYAPELERGIIWNDPSIGIKWPISKPQLSTKDLALPLLQDIDSYQESP